MTNAICLVVLCLVSSVVSANPDDELTEHIRRVRRCLNTLKIYVDNPAQAPSDFSKGCLEVAQECTVAINRRIVAGANETTHVLIEGVKDMTLAAVRSEYCDKLTARAEFLDDQIRTAKEELEAKLTAPFRRAGLRGDKLELAILAKRRGATIFGVGGATLTLAQIKRARLLFVPVQNDGQWTLHRFAFKGDAVMKQTHANYAIRPDASKFR